MRDHIRGGRGHHGGLCSHVLYARGGPALAQAILALAPQLQLTIPLLLPLTSAVAILEDSITSSYGDAPATGDRVFVQSDALLPCNVRNLAICLKLPQLPAIAFQNCLRTWLKGHGCAVRIDVTWLFKLQIQHATFMQATAGRAMQGPPFSTTAHMSCCADTPATIMKDGLAASFCNATAAASKDKQPQANASTTTVGNMKRYVFMLFRPSALRPDGRQSTTLLAQPCEEIATIRSGRARLRGQHQ